MNSKLTALAATLFAAAAFTVPAAATTKLSGDLVIDGTTYTLTDDTELSSTDTDTYYGIYITNGGALDLASYSFTTGAMTSVTITDSSYLVWSDSEDFEAGPSSATFTGDGTGFLCLGDNTDIYFDADYLAELVAGTATEYTFQIFESSVLSNSELFVYVDSSWKNVDGIESVVYDASTGAVTVTLVAVPEPGAFGMFAGIAALAFVAARRTRRSRKIA